MTPARLAEIRERALAATVCPKAQDANRKHIWSGGFTHAECVTCRYTCPRGERAEETVELLAEVQRLTDELDAWGQRESADAAAGSYAARAETAETERDEARAIIRAIRGWTRSRLEILDHLRPQSGQNAGKITILNDLTSVLDHLAPHPAAAVDGTR